MAEKEPLLTKDQVNAVTQFAQGLYLAGNMGFYSPWMQNELLNSLNNNPKVPTMENLQRALADYKNSADNIQSYIEFMKHWDMIFSRTLQSYANVLAFDLQIVCSNAFTDAEYQSQEYKEDKQRIYKFLNAFDYQAEFRKVVMQMLTTETAFYWFRRTKWGNKGMKGTLQLLPQDHCLLTGYWEKGLLFDFNMAYFLNAGVDIDGFDPVFKKYYNNVFGKMGTIDNYIPTNPLSQRNGTYAMWTQTSPTDGAYAFKFNMSDFNATPFLAPFLKNTLRNAEIEELQYSKDYASAYAILAGEIRLFDNAKSGTTANQFAIDPKTLGSFMGKVKQGLPKEVKAVAMPTENTHLYQFTDSNKDMYGQQLSNSAGVGGGISRVMYSSDRMSNAELQYAAEAQYAIMKNVYPQFQNFLEFYANKLTKKYKFKFIFDGCAYEYEREKRFDRLMKLSDKGMVLNSSAYASALGMKPQDFDASLSEGHYGDLVDKLTLLLNANTSKDGGVGGRPTSDDAEITDSAEASRDNM